MVLTYFTDEMIIGSLLKWCEKWEPLMLSDPMPYGHDDGLRPTCDLFGDRIFFWSHEDPAGAGVVIAACRLPDGERIATQS
jgi:hypothetical protein